MSEERILVRDVLEYGPDGNSVRHTEIIAVEIITKDGLKERRPDSYTTYGEWRVLPKEPAP